MEMVSSRGHIGYQGVCQLKQLLWWDVGHGSKTLADSGGLPKFCDGKDGLLLRSSQSSSDRYDVESPYPN